MNRSNTGNASRQQGDDRSIRRSPLGNYYLAACGISWLIWSPLWLPAFGFEALPVLPYHHAMGALGPVAAAFVVSFREAGLAGPVDLIRRMILWRERLPWIAIAIFAPLALPVLAVAGAGLYGAPEVTLDGIGRSQEYPGLSAGAFLLYNIITFGYGEETGWRGFALPRLQARYSAFTATLLVTLGWAVWHLPLFFYRPGYISMDAAGIGGWFFSLLTGSVLLTWLYNESRGSLLVAAIFHATINLIFTSDMTSPAITNFIGVLITVWGLLVLVAAGPRYLSRKGKMVSPDHGPHVTMFQQHDP